MTSISHQRKIAIWLFICCFVIFAMVVLGGVTRLTGSGLSMVKWEPITGVLPPMNQNEWQETFELYKQFPEYQKKNYDMDLGQFKSIFWFEYAHRLLGRSIGIIFLLPFLFFLFTGRINKPLLPKLIGMFALGGLQGLMGWYMVKSGLVQDPHVSQYRLTAHLALAIIIYGYIFWVALDLFYPKEAIQLTHNRTLQSRSLLLSLLVFITALSGGFVAGLRAGHAYNTFPLMNGQAIPDGLFNLIPAWTNFFENVTTVQFDHRVLATLLFIVIPLFWYSAMRSQPHPRVRTGLHLLLLMLAIQITLGISTLLLHVPVPLASAHQAGALMLFTSMLFVSHQMRNT